jgi:ADP-heptose:LPS heptosyltransferase
MNPKTIVYFKHGIGNLIMMSPALRALASMEESGKVDVCLSATWQDARRQAFDDILPRWDIIGQIVNHPRDKVRQDYDRWYYTGHSEASEALSLFQAKAKETEPFPMWEADRVHEILYYMRLVYRLGYKGPIPEQSFPITELPQETAAALGALPRPVVFLCNGTYSAGMKGAKQWRGFSDFSRVLRAYTGGSTVKVGFGDELKDTQADLDLVGKLTITQTAQAIASSSNLFITTDTGLMHVGDALCVNMLVIFGGSLVSKNGPISRKAEVITRRMPCQPCQKAGPFYDCATYNCLEELTVGEVMARARARL